MAISERLPRGWLRIVEVVLVLDVLVLYTNNIIGPVVLQNRFAKNLGYPDWSHSNKVCMLNTSKKDLDKRITSQAATWNYYIIAIQLSPAIFIALVMGTLSDRFGRRPMMLIGTCGIFVGSLFTFLFQQFDLPLGTLLVGGFLQGASGGQALVLTTILAYIVDDCSEGNRTIRLTIAEAIMWLMSGLGQALGGFMTTDVSVISACILVLVLLVVQFIYIFFFLKESLTLPAGEIAKVEQEDLKESLKTLFRNLRKVFIAKTDYRRIVWTLMLVDALMMTIIFGTSGLDTLFYMQTPFCLTSAGASRIGLTSAIVNCVYGVVIAPLLVKIFKLEDTTLCQIGIFSYMFSRVSTGLSWTEWMLYVSAVIGMPAVAVNPVVRSMVSKEVQGTHQGALFAMVSALETVATIIGSVLYGSLFSFFIAHSVSVLYSGMSPGGYSYFIQGLVLGIAFILLNVAIFMKRNQQTANYEPLAKEAEDETKSD